MRALARSLLGQGRAPARLRAAACTAPGPRNASNEDAFLNLHEKRVFAVSDGMGGHVGGHVASSLAINTLRQGLLKGSPTAADIEALIQKASAAVYTTACTTPRLSGMGCTLVVAWVDGDCLRCFNVGDSRAYRLRDYRLEQLTRDHSTTAYKLTRSEDRPEERRALTRAVGMGPNIKIDMEEYHWLAGDELLLVTDGVTDVLPDFQITNLLVETDGDISERVEALILSAIAANGTDDKTAVLVTAAED